MPSQFYLSAAHKSSGKTMVAIGLSSIFYQQNKLVQTFKKGLDYIDPIWLSLASGRSCYNLDFYTSTHSEITHNFETRTQGADIVIIEGNKGLYDGITTQGGDSNADLAKLLKLAVILVVDTTGITRGIAPLLQGYQNFEQVNIAGVILNKVASNRHQTKLRQATEAYTDLVVLGAIGRDEQLFVKERYLGLKPANEDHQATTQVGKIAKRISQEVDLVQLSKKTTQNPTLQTNTNPTPVLNTSHSITLAVAKDRAFGFYYADDMQAFAEIGVKIIYFDTLTAKKLPAADALLIGGGFPEVYAPELSANQSLQSDIKTKIKQGLPAYAECGGLMYLTEGIHTQVGFFKMTGVITAQAKMHKKPIGRGYVQLSPKQNHPWQVQAKTINAHEFHYSELINISTSTQYAYTMLRGVGTNNRQDGIITHNLLACYSHLRRVRNNDWVSQFVNFVKKVQKL